jgi:hypothetical protein
VALASILQALKVAEAQVYLAATALLKALPGYKQEAANLAASVNLAANAIERDEELEDLMYMSNCIAGWLWLHKFQDMLKRHTDVPHSPAVAIKMLRFDADAYIQG